MDSELRGMVMSYRVTELQALLAFAGKNKQGRKNELQARCLELVKAKTPQVVLKMKELYRSIQMSHFGQPLSLTGSNAVSAGATASMAASRYDSTSYYAGGYKLPDNSFGRSIGFSRQMSGDGQYRTVPICPDVKMKELPFYDIHSVLIRPTSLINQSQMAKQETQNSFCLTPSQAAAIASSREICPGDKPADTKVQFNVQVQLRCCALDPSSAEDQEQDDLFPQSLIVKVNGRNVQLPHPIPSNRPGVEPKRPSKPLNVTTLVKCSPTTTNTITVQWVADATKNFAMSVYIVRRLTADELFQRLKNKRIQPADFTRGRIKEITTAEEEDLCAPTSIRVSVACPLGKSRMSYPCRATSCKHLQCFDAILFLRMNEKKPNFMCPVCNKHLKFGDLSIDGYFLDVIKELSIDAENEIELYPDGRWEPAHEKVKKEIEDVGPPPKRIKSDVTEASKVPSFNKTIDLDEDDIMVVEEDAAASSSKKSAPAEPEVIDLIDSSDEGEDEVTRMSGGSETMLPTQGKEMEAETVPAKKAEKRPQVEEDDDDDSDEDVGIRRLPRRRAKKVNYVEDSSSDSSTANEGTSVVVTRPAAQQRQHPGSPACIDLSDSAPSSPEPPQRAFAAVSGQSSSSRSASAAASSHPNNNRSGSGSSTLYSSSPTTTPTSVTTPTPTGIGPRSSPLDSIPTPPSLLAPSANNFTYSSSSSQSASLFNAPPLPSSYYSSTSTAAVPGYAAYDPRSWETDLNSFINVQQQLGYGSMNMAPSFDYLNPSTHHHPSNYGYGAPRPPRGAGPGGGYPGWM